MIALATSLAVLLSTPAAPVTARPATALVLDAPGSTWGLIGDRARIEIARERSRRRSTAETARPTSAWSPTVIGARATATTSSCCSRPAPATPRPGHVGTAMGIKAGHAVIEVEAGVECTPAR